MPFVMEMHWPEIGVDEYEEARGKVAWERDDRLMPVMAGEMGITSQPKVRITPAHAAFVPHARVETA